MPDVNTVTNVLPTDPQDWETDPQTEDLIIPIRYVSGAKAVAQRCRIQLKMYMGELFFDRRAGTPWLENDFVTASEAIMGDAFDRTQVDAAVRRILLSILYVSLVKSVVSTFVSDTRTMNIVAGIVDIWGNESTVEAGRILTV